MKTPLRQHLVIVGGGMVGASLAIALSGRGLRITLVEAYPAREQSPPSYDDRALALAYGTRRIFETLGLWADIAGDAEPIRDIHVSDKGLFGFTRLAAADENVPALGYVITARELGKHLLAALGACEDVTVIAPATVTGFDTAPDAVRVHVERDGLVDTLEAELLVAADGNRSAIREQLGVPVREWQYGQSAIVTNVSTTVAHGGTAYERFTGQGPLALLPMTEGRFALVWTVDDAELEEKLALDDSAFLAEVQARFGYRKGRFVRVGQRQAYPLQMIRALESTGERVAVIGNAAHTLHPIAGQGFNLGIRDVAVLAEVILDGHAGAGDCGDADVLRRYAEWRRREQAGVSVATDTLARVFANPLLPVRLGRNLGMLALDLVPGAKHLLARAAMGLNGRLPGLTRGASLD